MSHADWLCRMVVNGLFLLFCISLLACRGGVASLFVEPEGGVSVYLMPIGYVEWLLIDCFCSVLACWHAVEV